MASRKGKENKSTASVKALVQSTVNFVKLIKKLEKRAMIDSDAAAKLLFEYGFGKAPQPMQYSGQIEVKQVEVVIHRPELEKVSEN
jgi:hypothetical protein